MRPNLDLVYHGNGIMTLITVHEEYPLFHLATFDYNVVQYLINSINLPLQIVMATPVTEADRYDYV